LGHGPPEAPAAPVVRSNRLGMDRLPGTALSVQGPTGFQIVIDASASLAPAPAEVCRAELASVRASILPRPARTGSCSRVSRACAPAVAAALPSWIEMFGGRV